MRILGIDYGRKKIGLALSENLLADPYMVIRFNIFNKAIKKIKNIVEKEDIEKIVVGISEGKMAEEEKEFGERLKKEIDIQVEYFDETLTTHDAQEFSQVAGVKRIKRRAMEDAYAASLMLQSYLASK